MKCCIIVPYDCLNRKDLLCCLQISGREKVEGAAGHAGAAAL